MKKIFLALLVVSSFANAQVDTTKLFTYPPIYNGYRFPNLYLDSFLRAYFPLLSRDTTNRKILVSDAYGNVTKTNWLTGGISGITADNGLTASTSTNVQLGYTNNSGSPLLHNTYINTDNYTLNIRTTQNVTPLRVEATTSTSYAINAIAVNGFAIYGTSTNTNAIVGQADAAFAAGIYGQSTDGWAGFFMRIPAATNTVVPIVVVQRQTQGTAANGMGGSIDFNIQNSNGSAGITNQLISKLTDATAATRTSQFIITGVDAGTTRTLMTADGNGGISMPGAGTPSATLSVVNTINSGINVQTTSGNGIETVVQGGIAASLFILPSSTNTIAPVINISRGSSGTASDGIGGSIDFYNKTSGVSGQPLSNQLISKWATSDNATRISQFIIRGVTSTTTQDWLTIGQSGFLQVRPMTVTEAGALTPAEGMIVFVSNTNGTWTSIGLWCYQNGAWHAL